MERKKKETKLQELERRIADLERSRTMFIQQPYQPAVPFPNQIIQQGMYQCQFCKQFILPNSAHYCNYAGRGSNGL